LQVKQTLLLLLVLVVLHVPHCPLPWGPLLPSW
jgi:hypothetical protein